MQEAKITFHPANSKDVEISCEIAKNIVSKMKGLMHRETLPADEGMLFTFLFPWYRYFWMKNVKIPLDIIFINRNFEIISIHEAPVESGFLYKRYSSQGLCKYVLETNQGFCKKYNISKGTKIEIEKS